MELEIGKKYYIIGERYDTIIKILKLTLIKTDNLNLYFEGEKIFSINLISNSIVSRKVKITYKFNISPFYPFGKNRINLFEFNSSYNYAIAKDKQDLVKLFAPYCNNRFFFDNQRIYLYKTTLQYIKEQI